MKVDVIILAGGLGTRLRSVVSELPKPMAPVNEKPFLHYILASLEMELVDRIILAVGYKHELIRAYVGTAYRGRDVLYSVESEPLGTGGGIKKALALCRSEQVLILNGDTFVQFDLSQLLKHHLAHNNDLTIALMHMKNPQRYGTVDLQEGSDQIVAFREKQADLPEALINCGVYLLNRELLAVFPSQEKCSFESDVLEKQVDKLHFGAYREVKRFIDIGIPEDYERAQDFFS